MIGTTIENYLVLAELGCGGMGVVYSARPVDRDDDPPVALKVIHPELVTNVDVFDRFRREAELGRSIDHENVVRTLDVGKATEASGSPIHYLILELVEGQTLRRLVDEIGAVAEGLVLDIARQICAGLDAIHARGIVHRDLKPANVIITADHHVKIMDLGIAKLQSGGTQLTRTGQFVGSLAYAAPELFGGDDAVDGRADLYALGILLYELATGTNPFDAGNIPATLNRLLSYEAPPLRKENDRISAFLEAAVARLLQKDPAERFASASELAAALEGGVESTWWGENRLASTRMSGLPRRRRDAPPSGIRGRDAEIAALLDAWRRTRGGASRALLVQGPVGSGKSALVEEAFDRIDDEEGIPSTVTGRALARGRALLPVVEILERVFRIDERPSAERQAFLIEEISGLLPDRTSLVPSLAAWILGAPFEGAPGTTLSPEVLSSSLAALFRALAERSPMAIHLDDLQRADRETIAFLPQLLRTAGRAPLLVVLGRSEDARAEPDESWLETHRWLRGEKEFETIELGPLDDAAVESILRDRLQSERLVAELGPIVRERASGSPYRLFEILTHLERRGILRQMEGAPATLTSLPVLDLPDSVRELMKLRLRDLTQEERELLDVAAVVGFQFDLDVVASALEVKRLPLLTRLARLERVHRLVRSEGASFRFEEGMLHETVYEEIPSMLRAAYHAVVADVLLAGAADEPSPEVAFELSDHLLRGDRGTEAAPFLARALSYLNGASRTREGADLADRGLEVISDVEPACRAQRLEVILAARSFHHLLGRWDLEREQLAEALDLARSLGNAEAESKVQLYRSGLLQAMGSAEEAGETARESLALAVRAESPAAEADARMAVGVALLRKGRFAEAGPEFEQALRVRRELADVRGIGAALMNLGVVAQRTGDTEQAGRRYEEARAEFETAGNRRAEALALNNLGTLAKEAGRSEEALDLFLRSLRRKCEAGDRLGERTSLRNLASVHLVLGRLEDARLELLGALEIAREIGNRSGEAESLEGLAAVLELLGDHPGAAAHAEAAAGLARDLGESRTRALALRTLGRILIAAGDTEAGRARLEEAIEPGSGDSSLRLELHLLLAWAAVEEGSPTTARSDLEAVESLAEELGRPGYEMTVRALRARLAAREGSVAETRALAGPLLEGVPGVEVDSTTVAHALLAWSEATDEPPQGAALDAARAEASRTAASLGDEEARARFVERSWPARVLVAPPDLERTRVL